MINPQNVDRIFKSCLFLEREVVDGKPQPEMIEANGILNKFGLHQGRVNRHKDEIIGFLRELPENFFKSKGGGWSFLNLCTTKDGELWTGEHRVMEQLVCLGIAIGKVKYLFPKEVWSALPGGMPYVVIEI